MGTATQVTVQEYLRDFSDSSFEYVDGVLIERPMPTWMHSILQLWIGGLIMRASSKYLAGSEVHARLRETEYRISDIAVQLRDIVMEESHAEKPPVLCVEILSPDDRLGATFAKCERYHDWGVPVCWIIDPMKRRAWVYAQGGEPALQDVQLEAGEIRVSLADAFSPLQ